MSLPSTSPKAVKKPSSSASTLCRISMGMRFSRSIDRAILRAVTQLQDFAFGSLNTT
jgi:hypothetical protein